MPGYDEPVKRAATARVALIALSVAGCIGAVIAAVRVQVSALAISLAVAVGADIAGRMLSRRSPVAMPYVLAWTLFLPRWFQSPSRLKSMLELRPDARVLEIGPGVGIHALPVAADVPAGAVHALDVQRPMLSRLARRLTARSIGNVRLLQADARGLPYADGVFDSAYLVSVLGEIPDRASALTELSRVVRPGGALVISEIAVDPDFVPFSSLCASVAEAGFRLEKVIGRRLAYVARFRRLPRK